MACVPWHLLGKPEGVQGTSGWLVHPSSAGETQSMWGVIKLGPTGGGVGGLGAQLACEGRGFCNVSNGMCESDARRICAA